MANVDEAKKFLIGVWTHTGREATRTLPVFGKLVYWLRLEFQEDGTVLFSNTRPIADEWERPTKAEYEVITGKYSDTGQRFFGAEWNGSLCGETDPDMQEFQVHITENDLVLTRKWLLDPTDRWQTRLTRGNKNPFSK